MPEALKSSSKPLRKKSSQPTLPKEDVETGEEIDAENAMQIVKNEVITDRNETYTAVPTSTQSSMNDGKRRITIGEYEISLPEEKIPLLGVMACSILLHLSIFIDDEIYVSKYRYGIILSAIAFFGAMVSVVVPSKQAIPLNYFIYVLTYAGACITTHETGPFHEPGNGYFASW